MAGTNAANEGQGADESGWPWYLKAVLVVVVLVVLFVIVVDLLALAGAL